MFGGELYVALIVGVLVSLLFSEKFGVLPAGLIIPGYLALIIDQPLFLAVVFTVSIITFLLVTQVIGRFVTLYGRRKFATMMVVGIVLKMAFDYMYPVMPFVIHEFRGLGVIVPGLLANTIQRQGIIPTVTTTLFLSGLTFLIVLVYQAV
ncbi:poly-gamma-glutamate biosynthesis protein PgsC [Salipaludibacillus aurantiacus]|uniref:Poly-gamma-glutamate biosynthesis protein PgsC/CapC n=1 Tax=Salipaludibacillus aurantiacus TaxID=1601833 RepID=A0A1H9X533_9BACI|nr:poly-gamma-glutamate biosynthesis protein PgsC [Salipaludibacillus aurantiacus]SES41318.1 poly-gamma-glutamate biosynthesis protein PgsC/CapC [Salipaludibacillus aurantiacus]